MKSKITFHIILLVAVVVFASCEAEDVNSNPFESLPPIDFSEEDETVTIVSDDKISNFINEFDIDSHADDEKQSSSVDSEISLSSGIITIIDDISDTLSSTSEATISESDSYSAIIGTENTVWIPDSGKKYHKSPDCSNMKSPQSVSLGHAKELGYEPCKRCYK